jgi:hypothetical protein
MKDISSCSGRSPLKRAMLSAAMTLVAEVMAEVIKTKDQPDEESEALRLAVLTLRDLRDFYEAD